MFKTTVVWIVTFALLASGCTTMKTVRVEDPRASPFGRVKAGDTVIVHTLDGKTDRFVVAAVEADALVSVNGGRYRQNEIKSIDVKSLSVPKTVGLGIGVFFGVVIIMLAVAVGSFFGSY